MIVAMAAAIAAVAVADEEIATADAIAIAMVNVRIVVSAVSARHELIVMNAVSVRIVRRGLRSRPRRLTRHWRPHHL
jgi:hypothetical protein